MFFSIRQAKKFLEDERYCSKKNFAKKMKKIKKNKKKKNR